MSLVYKFDRFWFTYFFIRLFYLFFTVLIYCKLTSLGDTVPYLSGGINFRWELFCSSTVFMRTIGGMAGMLAGSGSNVITNFPFMLLSFCVVKWVVETLEFRKYMNKYMLLTILSLPNFCIWTSVCSKEMVGLVFSSILGVLLVNYLKGNYKIRIRDILGCYLCLIFKPQYLPFILQGLMCVYWMQTHCKKAMNRFLFGVFVIFLNIVVLYQIRDIVNQYAEMIPIHFTAYDGASNRDGNIWPNENDFFRKAPMGMFTAFFGPTLEEMLDKPTHLIAGIESMLMLIFFVSLCWKAIGRFYYKLKIDAILVPVYFIVFSGICLLHYPFGIFNPGSAIRYRTNFIFLFIILLMYLNTRYKKQA